MENIYILKEKRTMKKHTFYSLVLGTNFKPVAKKWDGFTDGKYNYYKNEYKKWFAIEPLTGLSVINSRNTRKECEQAANTPEMLKKVKNAITLEKINEFIKYVSEVCEPCL